MISTANAILAARDWSPAFDEARQPLPTLLRFLKQKQLQLLNDVVRICVNLVLNDFDINFPLAVFEDGVPFPESFHIRDGTVITPPTGPASTPFGPFDKTRVQVVSWDRRIDPADFPTVYIRRAPAPPYFFGTILYLTGTQQDWPALTNPVSYLRMFYVPFPLDPNTSPQVDLILPEFGEPLVQAELALFMAYRGLKDPNVKAILPELRTTRNEAQKTWTDSLIRQQQKVAHAQDDYGGYSASEW